MFKVDDYTIDEPIMTILQEAQGQLTNGKLRLFRQTSSGISVTCPFHANGQEHKNSCFINPENGIFHCFTCDVKGTFAKFIAACFDFDLDTAKQWLVTRYGTRNSTCVKLLDDIDIYISKAKKGNSSILTYSELCNYTSYCPYLQKRHVSREIATKFSLKYDAKNRQVLFPIFDSKGALRTIVRRSIDTKYFMLENDVEKFVYGLNFILQDNIKSVLLVEGQFDCLVAWSFGFPAVAFLGNISPEQIEAINKSCIEHAYLAFDNDSTGKRFTALVKQQLAKRILVSEVKIPKEFKDIGELSYDIFWSALNNAKTV